MIVGTPASGEGGDDVGEALAAMIEKRWEVACMTPCVELRKMRK